MFALTCGGLCGGRVGASRQQRLTPHFSSLSRIHSCGRVHNVFARFFWVCAGPLTCGSVFRGAGRVHGARRAGPGGVGGRGAGIGGPGLASEVGVLRFRTFWAPLGGFLVGSWCTPNADVAVNRGFPRVRRRSTPSSDGTRPIWVPSLSEVGAHQLRTGGQTGQSEQGNPGREAWAGHAAGQFAQDKGAAPQGAAPW